MKKILIFDTETTGLVEKGLKWETDYMKFPHIVQLAWWTELHGITSRIINPNGWVIPDESIEIHGITNERANKEGVPLKEAMLEFIFDCAAADTIVGHNVYFDSSVIKANVLKHSEAWRKLSSAWIKINDVNVTMHKDKRICTMMKTITFVGARQKDNNRRKFPSLVELHTKLFGESFEGAHDAVNDVVATKRCYYELVRIGVI